MRVSYRGVKSSSERYSRLRTFSIVTASPAITARGSTATLGSQSRSLLGFSRNHQARNSDSAPSKATIGCQSGRQTANIAIDANGPGQRDPTAPPGSAAHVEVNRAGHPNGNQGTRQQRCSRDDSQYEAHKRFLFWLTQRIARAG